MNVSNRSVKKLILLIIKKKIQGINPWIILFVLLKIYYKIVTILKDMQISYTENHTLYQVHLLNEVFDSFAGDS